MTICLSSILVEVTKSHAILTRTTTRRPSSLANHQQQQYLSQILQDPSVQPVVEPAATSSIGTSKETTTHQLSSVTDYRHDPRTKATPITDKGTDAGSKYIERTPYKGQQPTNATDDYQNQPRMVFTAAKVAACNSTKATNRMQHHRQQKSPREGASGVATVPSPIRME